MKLRSMTWGWWVELVLGVLLPTLWWGLLCVAGVVFVVGAIGSFLDPTDPLRFSPKGDFFLVVLAWMVFAGLLGLGALWLLILFGPDQIKQRTRLRWFSVLSILSAEAAAFCFVLLILRQWIQGTASGQMQGWGPMVVVLIAPVVLGLKYLPRLLSGKP